MIKPNNIPKEVAGEFVLRWNDPNNNYTVHECMAFALNKWPNIRLVALSMDGDEPHLRLNFPSSRET